MCQLLLVGQPFPKVLLLLQLCAERNSFFCHLTLFRLKRSQFLVSQQHNAARLRLQFLQLRLLFGLHHVDFPTDARVDFRTRQFLQDIRFFLLLAFQELGKLSLCQQRGPAELLKGETDTPLYLHTCFGRLIRERSTVLQGKCPDHFLDFPSSLVARPCHAPHGPQGIPCCICKPQLHLCRHTVAPHQHAGIVNAHLTRTGKAVALVQVAFIGRLLQARSGVIKCQTHRIQQRRLAGSRRSANQEDGILAQWPVLKINARLLDGGYIFNNQFL